VGPNCQHKWAQILVVVHDSIFQLQLVNRRLHSPSFLVYQIIQILALPSQGFLENPDRQLPFDIGMRGNPFKEDWTILFHSTQASFSRRDSHREGLAHPE
jgi:hypothetical protein